MCPLHNFLWQHVLLCQAFFLICIRLKSFLMIPYPSLKIEHLVTLLSSNCLLLFYCSFLREVQLLYNYVICLYVSCSGGYLLKYTNQHFFEELIFYSDYCEIFWRSINFFYLIIYKWIFRAFHLLFIIICMSIHLYE